MKWTDLLDYNEQTGELVWRERTRLTHPSVSTLNSWNSRFAGKLAGSPSYMKKRGNTPRAINVSVSGVNYLAHRIIWEMRVGTIDAHFQIDHIDGNPFNNRLTNLRISTRSQNLSNRGKQRNNVCGLKGVFKDTRSSGWIARIRHCNQLHHLGLFPTKGLAALAYTKASLRYHGKFSEVYRQEIAYEASEKKSTHFQNQGR